MFNIDVSKPGPTFLNDIILKRRSKYTIYTLAMINVAVWAKGASRQKGQVFPGWAAKFLKYSGFSFRMLSIRDFLLEC